MPNTNAPSARALSRLCLAAAAAACGVRPAEIASPRRGPAPVARARQLAAYLQHVAFGASLSACGACFRRDRASIRHACARVEDARDDPRVDSAVARLEQALIAERQMLRDFAVSFQSDR